MMSQSERTGPATWTGRGRRETVGGFSDGVTERTDGPAMAGLMGGRDGLDGPPVAEAGEIERCPVPVARVPRQARARCGPWLLGVLLAVVGWVPWPEPLAHRLGLPPGRPVLARYEAKEVWKRLRLARFNLPFPDDPHANDLAGILSAEDLSRLRQILRGVEARTGVEVAAVTVKSAAAHGAKHPQELAEDFLFVWGIGHPKPRNGVLFLVSRDDVRAVLALGEGWKPSRAAALRQAVERAVGNHLRSGRLAVAVLAGAREIAAELERPIPLTERPWFKPVLFVVVVAFLGALGHSLATTGEGGWGYLLVDSFVKVMMVLLIIMTSSSRRRRHRWYGGSSGSWGSGGDSRGGGGWSSSGGGGSWGNW
ncbi:MAG: Beta-propeller domains of methanol dehydrogenase type [Candidatus Ozemobacter sibiricus]|uniref:Beta-propeller domains of methanol dehydrogenase type n=1 Tax=Candidatus Ozemobacter sibiricus TaxID=2268124 RepID=A0A367ZPY9_9BACT|nr:MAG: Beta-propeller domains of methanol dehydrogenase type [Candidatus Ozemobacter sibiricus]